MNEQAASSSAELSERFFAAAPLRHTAELAPEVERQFREFGTVSLALSRVIALATAIPWLIYLIFGRITLGLSHPAQQVVWLWFIIVAGLVVAAAVVHRRRCYFLSLLAGGGSFCLVLVIHIGFILATGSSPLAGSFLGDFAGLPVAMLATVLPIAFATPVAAVVIAAAVTFNLGTPLGLNTVLEIAHAELLLVPFLMLLQSSRATTQVLDDVVRRARRRALRAARTKALAAMETHFLGYLHDRVLTFLNGISNGVLDVGDRTLREDVLTLHAPETGARIPVGEVVAELVEQAPGTAPGIILTTPDHIPAAVDIPAEAAAALHDAALEAAANTLRHAPGAPASLTIEVEVAAESCTRVRIVVRDEGPGFGMSEIPPGRAGVRVSMEGRMKAVDGGDMVLDSHPGDGTTVELSWSVTGPAAVVPDAPGVIIPQVYELVGIGRVFRPRYAVLAWLVFVGLSLNNVHLQPQLLILALGSAAVALGALVTGDTLRLPARSTVIAATAILVFFVAAGSEFSEPARSWPQAWFPWVFVLLCSYLALRDRAGTSLLVWLLGLAAAELPGEMDLAGSAAGAAQIIPMSTVLLVAVLIPRMIRLTTSGLPLALELNRNRTLAAELLATRTRFVADSTVWLRRQVTEALSPDLAAQVRRSNAALLEQRLRDSIRSPGFDTVAVNRAVWDARARGLRVRLLDYRGEHNVDDERLVQVRRELIELLTRQANTDGVTITARILPPGRDRWASLVASGGGELQQIDVE